MVKRKDSVGETLGEIRYSGEFDYEKVYLTIYNWLKRKRYEVQETYKHKMTPKGAEVELSFKGGKKVTEFRKNKIEVEFKGWNITEQEVVKEGKKQKLNKGRLKITLSWTLQMDYNSKYDKSEFWIRVFNMMVYTFLYKKMVLDWAGSLVAETYDLHTTIKKSLGMECSYSAW